MADRYDNQEPSAYSSGGQAPLMKGDGGQPQASPQPQTPAGQQAFAQQPQTQPAYGAQPQGFQQPYAQQQAYAQSAYAQSAYAQQAYAAGVNAGAASAPRKSGKAVWVVLGVILFAIVFVFTIGALSCSHVVSNLSAPTQDYAALTTGDSVGVIDMAGTIQYDGTSCSPEGLRELLNQAEENPDIKAVVLRVDSGGGTATAGEEMAAYVRDFSKPIVVSSASMNCSAAYEISSQADYIFVNETTAIGAIGTIMQSTDISELLDKLGISVDNIASADSKDSSYGTRPLTDEERAYYQELVDTINETFINSVAEGRDMTVEEVRALATGMQFAGTVAVENGLADEVGIYEDALDKAAQLGGIESFDGTYDVVSLTQSSSDLSALMDLLGTSESSSAAEMLLESMKQEGARS